MFQGTGSDVGKSIVTAGLCRVAARRGISVAPFKPQNMSNNAAVCPGGGEIGRAQALQAQACGLDPHTDMNPVLLKPQSDMTSQIVLQGEVFGTMQAEAFLEGRDRLMGSVKESFRRLASQHELVLVEGAGSPAETNLRSRDIANMGFARELNVPVCLIGDIEKGGVIASVVGTKAVLAAEDAAMIRGVLINKFRGDISLFDDGLRQIEEDTGWPSFGVIPWIHEARYLPAEDAVPHDERPGTQSRKLRIVAPMLSRMANFDDADPLRMEPGVSFEWVKPGDPIPRDADVVVLFGTKSTHGDLEFMKDQGWHHDIIAHARAGGRVLGICGGFQMLGRRVIDETGVDGPRGEAEGLGLLDVETHMGAAKSVAITDARCEQSGVRLSGYEIHAGETTGEALTLSMFRVGGKVEGARSADGRVEGTHLHGIFSCDVFRAQWLARAGATTSDLQYQSAVDAALDDVAGALEASVDVDGLFGLASPVT